MSSTAQVSMAIHADLKVKFNEYLENNELEELVESADNEIIDYHLFCNWESLNLSRFEELEEFFNKQDSDLYFIQLYGEYGYETQGEWIDNPFKMSVSLTWGNPRRSYNDTQTGE